MYEDYDWFLAEVEAQGGIMSTDYALINYITLEELTSLEDRGIIVRRVQTDGEADLIITAKQYVEEFILWS